MPPIPRVYTLPDDVRRELDQKIIANHFHNYMAISTWLASMGFVIGKSALQDYGSKLRKGKLDRPTPKAPHSTSPAVAWWSLPDAILAALAARLLADPVGPMQPHVEWLGQHGHRLALGDVGAYRDELVAAQSRQRCLAALAEVHPGCAMHGDALR